MFARALSGSVVAAALALGGAAYAQPGLSTAPDYDLIYKADRIDDDADNGLAQLRQQGLAALQGKDFAAAEAAFSELLRRKPSAVGASFMLGLSKIGLEKWDEAKVALERAVVEEPDRPEPKTRLGLTHVMLQNAEGAREQRDALVMLDVDCKGACKDALWIKDGIVALDQALAPGVKARVSGAALAAVAAPPTQPGVFDPAKYNPKIAAMNPSMSLEAMNIAAQRMRKYVLGPWTQAHRYGSMDPARWTALVSQMQSMGQLSKSVPAQEVMVDLLPSQ